MKNIFLFFLLTCCSAQAQKALLINNPTGRTYTSLNGHWEIIVDPYENGFFDYRLKESANGFFKNKKALTPDELVEYDFVKTDYLNVPGDWNSQRENLSLYEGTIWYKKDFDYSAARPGKQYLFFGAANYYSVVYLNGEKLGEHEGGFTPFAFDVTGKLKAKGNFVVVKVDNKRKPDGVPTVNTDWWNYGGITRDVQLVETGETFIQDYTVSISANSYREIVCKGKLNHVSHTNGKIIIPELHIEKDFSVQDVDSFCVSLKATPVLWSPQHPKLYDVRLVLNGDTVNDQIGFRRIETRGQDILLNGKPIFLKGICLHEEVPQRGARANGFSDASMLLGWAKELGCNYVRLAHYPHNEAMLKTADRLGILVWSEIPVYWTIHYWDPNVLEKAKEQLRAMVLQNHNRASVIIWSMANETPVSEERNNFIGSLCTYTKSLDPARLISAALEISPGGNSSTYLLNDPLGKYLDVLGCNEYLGWYSGKPADCRTQKWETVYNKPLVITEFGGDALYGLHGTANERWTEEYQDNLFAAQLEMLSKISFLRGMSPWVLADFRSPRRPLHGIQDFWNRKGLISDKGQKKKAYYRLQQYYRNK